MAPERPTKAAADRVPDAGVDPREVLEDAHDALAVVDHDGLARERERSREEHGARAGARTAVPTGTA